MEVDMSDKAITGRLKRVEQLRRLCLSLAKARPIEKPTTAPPEISSLRDNAKGQRNEST